MKPCVSHGGRNPAMPLMSAGFMPLWRIIERKAKGESVPTWEEREAEGRVWEAFDCPHCPRHGLEKPYPAMCMNAVAQ